MQLFLLPILGSDSPPTVWYFLFETIKTIVPIFALILAWKAFRRTGEQLKLMGDQLRIANDADAARRIMLIFEILQDKDNRKARMDLRTLLDSKIDIASVKDTSEQTVRTVCACYDSVGLLIEELNIPQRTFVVNWGSGIRFCFEAVRPYIERVQNTETWVGRKYCEKFIWLNEQVTDWQNRNAKR